MNQNQTTKSTKTIDDNRAFNELFVERHENVSILFADICKFTQLTTTLSVDKLVETLNDLFGKVSTPKNLTTFHVNILSLHLILLLLITLS